jgi:RsiW-degrading membrane proteinase PrsW (M82 family)
MAATRPSSLFQRLGQLSYEKELLKRFVISFFLGSLALAWVLGKWQDREQTQPVFVSALVEAVREQGQACQQAGVAQPREFIRWLRLLLENQQELSEELDVPVTDVAEYERTGCVLGYAVRALLEKHVTPQQQGFLHSYILLRLGGAETPLIADLKNAVALKQPPALANELLAVYWQQKKDLQAALECYVKEAEHHADATAARAEAVRLALQLADVERLRWLRERGWVQGSAQLAFQVGKQLNDLPMQWLALVRMTLDSLSVASVCLSLLCTGVWVLIFWQHGPETGALWRSGIWVLLALAAGVASVWPTWLWSDLPQAGLAADEMLNPGQALLQLVLTVGLREEVCKLVLASVFMPWLLRRGQGDLALITGAFVGLGFALEENLHYFDDFGHGVAVVRFVTANFMHAVMTGLTTHGLYELLRSRFHSATQSVTVWLLMVAAHALYDWTPPEDFIPGSYLQVILLALLSYAFWDALEAAQVRQRARPWFSPAAVFILGLCGILGVSFLLASQSGTRQVMSVAFAALSLAPIFFLYWHRFQGGLR